MESNNDFYIVKGKQVTSIKELHVKNMQRFIRENYKDRSITLFRLGRVFGMNKNYISNIFSEISSIKISSYLNYVRIHKAMEILIHQADVPIIRIAKEVGYNSPGHFTRVFKKFTGTTPMKYRLEMVPAPEQVEVFNYG